MKNQKTDRTGAGNGRRSHCWLDNQKTIISYYTGTPLRKCFIIFVLIALCFNEAGYFVYYSYQEYRLKEQVKAELASGRLNNFLEVIELEKNNNRITWREENREFCMAGEMYDVQRVETRNGKTYLHCLNDKKEKALEKEISKAVQQHTGKSSGQKNKHILKLQVDDYLVINIEASLPFTDISEIEYSIFKETPLSESREIVTPPPQYRITIS